MTGTTAPPPSDRDHARRPSRRRWSRRRWRRVIEIGCLPLTVLSAGGLVLLFAVAMFGSAPPYIYDPRSYMVGGRLGASASVLFFLQITYHWLNGLFAAHAGAQAARGQGLTLRNRLRIVQRRFFMPILATALLRIGFVVVLGLAYLYSYTRVLGPPIAHSFPGWFEGNRSDGVFVAAILGALIPYWLTAPFLRVRFSAALGALAGTWSYRPDERTSTALAARLGIGLAGLLALMWGATILLLVLLAAVNPASRYTYGYYNPYPSPTPPDGSQIAVAIFAAAAVLLGSQLVFAELLIRVTRRRLAGMRWPSRRRALAVSAGDGPPGHPASPEGAIIASD